MNQNYAKILNRSLRNYSGFLPPTKVIKLCLVLITFCTVNLAAESVNPLSLYETTFVQTKAVTVSGNIQDTNGDPLIGVSILVEGTTIGTISDIDGNYRLEVPDENSTLVFSYIGFKSVMEEINGRSTINVVMGGDDALLDEIVVIGYGTVKKSDLTGAVSSIDGKELTSLAVGNPTAALQGKVSGLQVENNGGQPGGAANVFVRGVSSFTNSFPLYVIDGTFADNMNYLNPKDIDRIEVLKDASAAAIYGSRAANGVVIISTKRGSDTGYPQVTLDLRAGREAPDNMLEFLTGPEFIAHRNQVAINDGVGPTLIDEGINTDWQDLSLNPGNIQDYGLSVAGGGPNSKYYISGNFFTQDGVLIKTGYDRTNLRANTEFTLGRFKVQQSLGITRSEIERNNWFGRDGSTAPILRESAPENEGGFEAPESDVLGFGGQNKYGLASLEEHFETDTKIFGNVNFSYEIIDGLTAKINLGADLLNRQNSAFRPTYFMSQTDAVDNVNTMNDLTELHTENFLTLIEPTLSYGREIGDGRIDVVVGATRQKIDIRSSGLYAQGLPNNDIRVLGAANPETLSAPFGNRTISGLISQFARIGYNHNSKYYLTATVRRDASSKFEEAYRTGVFPSVSAAWKISNEDFWSSNAITTLKLRAGYGQLGSQNIPDYSTKQVFNLTSGTSFNNQTVQGYAQTGLALQDLKWEVAKTANIGLDVGLFNDKLIFSAEYYNKDVEDVLVGVPAPAATGISDFIVRNVGEINNKGFEFEALYRPTIGKLNLTIGGNLATFNSTIVSLPIEFQGPSITEDIVVANRFIEGEAPGAYWGYVVDGVYADEAAIASDPNLANDSESVVVPGDFRRVDLDGDGKITGADQQVLGDPTPDFTYGLNLSGDVSGFDFGIFFQGVEGNEIFNAAKFYNLFWEDDNKIADIKNAWTPSNTNTDIPRASDADPAQNGAPSTFFVEDGSYFRLRTLEVGYGLNMSKVDWMRTARVFITGQNLFTLTQYSGYSPDISSVNGGRSSNSPFFGAPSTVNPLTGRGLDVRAYPNTRSIMFGVQIGF